MQIQRQLSCLTFFAIATLCLLEQTLAQRGSYAGSRPSGLSQKDKYHITTPRDSIANRFGDPNNSSMVNTTTTTTPNVLAFGAPQRPPVGYPWVIPESQYVPIAAPVQSQFSLENRLGDSDTQTVGSGAVVGNTNTRQPLPFDALGDQQLIDYLNRIPEGNRPFWFLNSQAIEAHRNGNGPKFSGAVASNQGSFFG